jgi:hypothetical protein
VPLPNAKTISSNVQTMLAYVPAVLRLKRSHQLSLGIRFSFEKPRFWWEAWRERRWIPVDSG